MRDQLEFKVKSNGSVIIDHRKAVRNAKDLDDIFGDIKLKLFGK